ncbi:MAG: 4-hydroxyproline epimerase [Gammaproteobacteria bacterium]|nr:4-hydroxyproline epimerase [Gammaproteobacteria bacterium]
MSQHTFFCIDGHTCGNPVRLVAGGGPPLEGKTQSERRQHFLAEYDWIRTSLMFEPRGNNIMSGAILYPPTSEEYDVAVLYIEVSGCLPMCGHGTIGTVTFAIEHGLVTPATPGKLRLETPAGLVVAEYHQEGNKVSSVKITNVPSFLYAKDFEFDTSELGKLKVDIAYGGNFYPILEPQENFQDFADYSPEELVPLGRSLYNQLNECVDVIHPEDDTIRGMRHWMWTGKATLPEAHARNAVVYGKTGLDRSPCGTGTCARLAQRAARGLLKTGEDFVHESIIHSKFIGRLEGTTKVGDFDAIIPSVEGSAYITGLHTISVDERDPYAHGFQVV